MCLAKYSEEVAFGESRLLSPYQSYKCYSELSATMLWITVTIVLAGVGLAMAGVLEHPDLPDDELGSSRSTSRRGKCE